MTNNDWWKTADVGIVPPADNPDWSEDQMYAALAGLERADVKLGAEDE